MVLTGQIGIRPKLKMIKFVGGGGILVSCPLVGTWWGFVF